MAELPQTARVFRFGSYEADLANRELRRDGRAVRLQGQPFEILALLLEHDGQLVTRDQLRARLWSAGTVVEFDHSVHTAITKLREALDDDADHPRFIATVPRHGYRFIAPIAAPAPTVLCAATGPMSVTARPFEPVDAVPATERRSPWRVLVAAAKLRPRVTVVIALIMTLGVAYFVTDTLRLPKHVTAVQQTTSAPGAVSEKSIAVLPFENRSDKPEDEFFVDGVHDDILTQLAKMSAIKVISRTSVEQFRGTKVPTKDIARQLGVTKILEGGVQRSGGRVHITVQLIDANSDGHLWAESYDRELTAANMFAIQREVATAIAAAMQTSLTAAETSRVNATPTRSLEAWEAYQLGQQRMAGRNSAGLVEAEKFFRRAIDLDSKFALAWAGLAATLNLQGGYSGAPRAATLASAGKAASTALKLDPSLAEAWAVSGLITETEGQDARAEAMFRRAIEFNPNNATAYLWLSVLLGRQSRDEEARTYTERAVALDPLSPVANVNLGIQLAGSGRFTDAEARFRKTIEIDPTAASAYLSLGGIEAYARNRFANAVALVAKAAEIDSGNPWLPYNLARLYIDLGDDIEASRVLAAARARWPNHTSVLWVTAEVAALRGDARAAQRDSEALLERDPPDAASFVASLRVLRNLDLRAGHYDAASRRYTTAYPDLVAAGPPKLGSRNWSTAIDLAIILQKAGDRERARALLDSAEAYIGTIPRLGPGGYGIGDVQIHALLGRKRQALTALREAEKAGWREDWRYHRDLDPILDPLRDDPEFKAVFADIESDMASQRAELAARPKHAPLDLAAAR